MTENTLGDLTNTTGISSQQNRKQQVLGEKDDNVREMLKQKLDFKPQPKGTYIHFITFEYQIMMLCELVKHYTSSFVLSNRINFRLISDLP
jgi:hypothetical protein